MRKIFTHVYELEELTEKVRGRIIEDFRNFLIEVRNENLEEEFRGYLDVEHNLKDFEVSYSLSDCQGDGVCFYNEDMNILRYSILETEDYNFANAFEKYILDTYKDSERFNEILEYLNEDNKVYIERDKWSRYTHLNTCTIECEGDNDFIYELCKELKTYVYNPICLELERFGYILLDVRDEEVVEYINVNEYEFYKNGQVYIG